MHFKSTLFIFLLVICSCVSKAQKGFSTNNNLSCGTSDVMEHLFQTELRYKQQDREIEAKLLNYKTAIQRPAYPQAVVTLPVVVHIIHNGGIENISDGKVATAIQHLNEAFANTGYYNPSDGVNTNIQFCMAQRDPYGNVTNGITRDQSIHTVMTGSYYYADDQFVKNINRWDPNCYINIWIVKDIPGSVAGYAYMPSAHGSILDGIIVEANFFGKSNADDVVTIHEMGHYLGLYHTFEEGCVNTDCLTSGDKVCDTPPDNSTVFTECGTPVNSCNTDVQSGFSSDQNDLTSDYMDYGNWSCMTVFTQGQSDRMNWFIQNVRNSLLNCKSCLPPCPAIVTANFSSSATSVTAGTLVNFTNASTNATKYSWYINNVQQSNAQNFSSTFSTPGNYTVKLVAAGDNSTLCNESLKEIMVLVTCPVKADFSSSAVEIPVGETINFSNLSTGTTGPFNWYLDNVLVSNSQDFSNQFNQPGSFTITLSVNIGTCSSSKSLTVDVKAPCSSNNYFEKMIYLPELIMAPKQTIMCRDSTIAIVGTSFFYFPGPPGRWVFALTVMKLSKNGNLLWTKNYYGPKQFGAERIVQLSDGNFLVAGLRQGPTVLNFFLMKIAPDGKVLWEKSYEKSGIKIINNEKFDLVETETHEYVLAASVTVPNVAYNTFIFKMNSSGDLMWSKEAKNSGYISSLLTKANSIYAIFANNFYLVPLDQKRSLLVKLDAQTGSQVYAKKYFFPPIDKNPSIRFTNAKLYGDQIQVYGNLNLQNAGLDTGSHVLATLDTFANIKSINRIRLNDPVLSRTEAGQMYSKHGVPLKNGGFVFFEDGSVDTKTYAFIHHNNLNNSSASTNKIMQGFDLNPLLAPVFAGDNDNLVEAGNNNIVVAISGHDKQQNKQGMLLYSSNFSGIVSPNCPIIPSTYINYPIPLQTGDASDFSLINTSFNTYSDEDIKDSIIRYEAYNICTVNNSSSCYSLKIISSDTICVANDSISITCRRNPGCTERINWSVSTIAQNAFRQINDSTIKIKFTKYGDYIISATLASCSEVTDTAHLFITKSASVLSLGPDKTLCNFSTAVLNAGSGFKSYKWYNGATDSSNTVYNVGTYYVTVTDYCNNTKSDTIKLNTLAAPPFNLGNDTILCSNDTLKLTAPAGYSSYTWASNYNISITTGQTVKLWPVSDTIYTVIAVYSSGCSVFDSIRVSVKKTIPVKLGNDTSFCEGNVFHLTAGSGFQKYLWTTGAITEGIDVTAAGLYAVSATSNNGCISKDTLLVLNVYSRPAINLGRDTSICKSEPLLLDAGNKFVSYAWQDNSKEQFFRASKEGEYWVIAIDTHGCTGSDTISVTKVLDTAANFIAPLFEICSYNNTKYIKPFSNYNYYLWSTGSTKDSIVILNLGTYWLQVKNSAGCPSRETFNVLEKNCGTGVYFPNAFTPDNDNLNNVFKALPFEELYDFKLIVYNRLGQVVFYSTDKNKGWNGIYKGNKQPVGAYVWTCTYKLKRTDIKVNRKGTILLLR